MKKNCPFCDSHVTAQIFAAGNGFSALYNHSPILPGHTLIIPDKHAGSLFELNEEEISGFFTFARKVTSFLTDIYRSNAYDWSLQEGAAAGQSVDHLHLHIIPRKPGDLPEGVEWFGKLHEQQSIAVDNPERIVLSEWEYKEISRALKEKWASFISRQ